MSPKEQQVHHNHSAETHRQRCLGYCHSIKDGLTTERTDDTTDAIYAVGFEIVRLMEEMIHAAHESKSKFIVPIGDVRGGPR